ncbi:alpha/beta fold hydrolase [Pseudonocardia endophytica]|uniref:Alpha/beta hydrolase family protein n=1 Tax=Pseudonocardia endophytica TaxID=401976 RepID=A0A4R1HLC7_PSEEN|nr:alpha/beta fold hydrolase [Pseudonocardia endophytica]TCK21110.1 alpha/beta hydrolase family protein [Pseudonocardia endophytica]
MGIGKVGRRTVLGSALASAGALAAGRLVPGARETVFVLVHGAWNSGAAWTEVVTELESGGCRALAVDLPGAGPHARFPTSYLREGQAGLDTEVSPLRDLTVEETADAVLAVLRRIRSHGCRRIVVVAHSLGGITATRAAEKAPHLIDELVYVAALVPTRLGSAAAYLRLPEAGPRYPDLYIGDPTAIGATRLNPRSTDERYRARLHEVFYGDVDEHRFLAYATSLVPDNPTGMATAVVAATAQRWGAIPRTYVQTERDRVVSPALQRMMIDDADRLTPGNSFRVARIDTSHSPFASRPRELAGLIAR